MLEKQDDNLKLMANGCYESGPNASQSRSIVGGGHGLHSAPTRPQISPLCERLRQYKIKSPHWKRDLKEDCVRRARAKRNNLTRERRNIASAGGSTSEFINEIVTEELNKLKSANSLDDADDFDFYLKVFEEIRQELEADLSGPPTDMEMAEEYEQFVEESDRAEEQSLYNDSIICPACLLTNLDFDHHNSFRCTNCHFQFCFPSLVMSRADIQLCFERTFSDHAGTGCALKEPVLNQVPASLGISTLQLIAFCQNCGFEQSVFSSFLS